MKTTPQVILAMLEVKKEFPNVSMVVFNNQGQWQFMTDDFESPTFSSEIDTNILEEASNSVYSVYGFPYVYQEELEEEDFLSDQQQMYPPEY